jgi:hypothetical protein
LEAWIFRTESRRTAKANRYIGSLGSDWFNAVRELKLKARNGIRRGRPVSNINSKKSEIVSLPFS